MRKSQFKSPSKNEIEMFLHCPDCMSELEAGAAPGESLRSYARYEMGSTPPACRSGAFGTSEASSTSRSQTSISRKPRMSAAAATPTEVCEGATMMH